MIKTIKAKLGNMRKEDEWVLYPQKSEKLDKVIIQCDKRIAEVNLTDGTMMLSDGKGGHQGFIKLLPIAGAKQTIVPSDVLNQLRELVKTNKVGDGIGTVTLT